MSFAFAVSRVFAQARGHELDDKGRQLAGQREELLENAGCVESAVGIQQRRLLPQARALAVVDAVMRESLSGLPSDRALIAVFAIGQLKGHGPPARSKPHEEVLLVRKEPPAPRLARYLVDVSDLPEHRATRSTRPRT